MEVEVTVKVDGQVVKTHVQQVNGTLEQMDFGRQGHYSGRRDARETRNWLPDAPFSQGPNVTRGDPPVRAPAALKAAGVECERSRLRKGLSHHSSRYSCGFGGGIAS